MSFQGTELSYAYGPLTGPGESLLDMNGLDQEPKVDAAPPKAVVQSTKTPVMPQQQIYDSKTINNQYDQEQKLMNILNEIKKQQKTVQQPESQSYVDKLYSKRKELWKALQISFIIIFALSVHFVVDHYLKLYINNTDLSFERELFTRLLYPVGIVFLLWNLKTFIK